MASLFLRRLELQVMHPPDTGCICRQKRRSYFLEIAVTYAMTQGVESPGMDLHDVQGTYSPALESKSLPKESCDAEGISIALQVALVSTRLSVNGVVGSSCTQSMSVK